jgi:hypothetical protein
MRIRKSAMRAQRGAARCIVSATQLTIQLAATHGHWFEQPAAKHAFPALKFWWKHFSKPHAIIADGLEWTGSGAVAVVILLGTLIGNA